MTIIMIVKSEADGIGVLQDNGVGVLWPGTPGTGQHLGQMLGLCCCASLGSDLNMRGGEQSAELHTFLLVAGLENPLHLQREKETGEG